MIDKINIILGKLVIFDDEFIALIKERLPVLAEDKLKRVFILLEEALRFQNKKIKSIRQEKEKKLIKNKGNILQQKDLENINLIKEKIKKI